MSTKSTFKPGQKAPTSGQLGITGPRPEPTVARGEPQPPTPTPGSTYRLVDATRHKR